MTVNLILGDCLEILPTLPDKSVEAIITDPPYYRITSNDWDNQWATLDKYIAWVEAAAVEWRRVLKDNGSLMVFADDKVSAYLQVMLDRKFLLLNHLVWYRKTNEMRKYAQNLRKFAPSTERILFYSAQYDPTGWETVKLDMNNFIPLREYFRRYQEATGLTKLEIIERVGQKADHCFRWGSTQWDLPTPETYAELASIPSNHGFVRREYEDLRREYEDLRREYEDLRRVFNADNNTFDVLEYPAYEGQKINHPTVKPLSLLERLVKVTTNPQSIVLDCFMGSGTTGVACIQTGRNFIGIEKEQKYYEIAQRRISEAQQQLLLPLEG